MLTFGLVAVSWMDIGLMMSREVMVRAAFAGYERTGQPLVAFDGSELQPAGVTDDIGLYYLVPRAARLFDLPIEQAVTLVLGGVLVIGVVVGAIGSLLYMRTLAGRAFAALGIGLVAWISLFIGDVYVVPAAITLAAVPCYLYLARRGDISNALLVFSGVAGIVIGAAHFLRSHAGTAVLLFIVLLAGLHLRAGARRKLALIALLFTGVLISAVYFDGVVDRRDAYLAAHDPEYVPPAGQHPFWHSVYIGFGFLNNRHGIHYQDEVAMAKVGEKAPDAAYLSPRYESVLRGEVFTLVRRHPGFVAATLFAKLGVIVLYLLIFANGGLLAAWVHPKPWQVELAFWGALALSALPGLLVLPHLTYLLGFASFAVLYGAVSVDAAAADWDVRKARRRPAPVPRAA